MKRATLTALPASGLTTGAHDLTDRLLNREPAVASSNTSSKPKRAAAPRRRAARAEPPAAPPVSQAAEDSFGPALRAAEQAVAALQLAARSEPARYEVALRYRLDSLAHHVQQVRDYLAASGSR